MMEYFMILSFINNKSEAHLELINYNLLNVLLHVTGHLLQSLTVQLVEDVVCYVVVHSPHILIGGVVVHFQVFFVFLSVVLDAVKCRGVVKLHFVLSGGNVYFVLHFNRCRINSWHEVERRGLVVIALKFQRERIHSFRPPCKWIAI